MHLVHNNRDLSNRMNGWTNALAKNQLGYLLKVHSRLKRENKPISKALVDSIAELKHKLGLY